MKDKTVKIGNKLFKVSGDAPELASSLGNVAHEKNYADILWAATTLLVFAAKQLKIKDEDLREFIAERQAIYNEYESSIRDGLN